MASFNRIIMIGNLTRDPDYKAQGEQGVCKLSIASNRQYRNKKTGALVQEVCYIDVDVWGAQAESCRQYLFKGKPVLVEGRLKLDTWEVDGQQRRKHLIVADRVVFLLSNQQNENSNDESLVSPATSTSRRKEEDNMQSTDFRKAKKKSDDILADNVAEVAFKDEPPFEEDLPF